MLNRTKRVLKRTWRHPWVWRSLGTWARPRGVAVLTYHRIASGLPFGGLPPERFEAQIRWLCEFFRPIAASELVAATQTPTPSRPAALVTFDDGYRDFHDVALPVLRRHRVPALVFLPTALIGSDQMLWTDRVTWLLAHCERGSLQLGGLELALDGAAGRVSSARHLKTRLKALPETDRQMLIDQLESTCGPAAPPLPRQMMNWHEVRACRDLVEFGGHSHHHPILARLGDRELRAEIDHCRNALEDELGQASKFFAYPNGRAVDFDQRTRRALRAAGFEVAFTTEPGWCDGADWLAVPRLPTGAANLSDFAWLLTHPAGAG